MLPRPAPAQAVAGAERVLLNGIFSINVGLTGNELQRPFPTVGAGRARLGAGGVTAERSEGLRDGGQTGGVGAAERPGSPLAASWRTRVGSKGFDLAHPGFPSAASLRPLLLPGFHIGIS